LQFRTKGRIGGGWRGNGRLDLDEPIWDHVKPRDGPNGTTGSPVFGQAAEKPDAK
jgi:hypothetical protein